MEEKKRLIIIAGPNGSGKTTFSNEYKEHYNLPYINNDEIAKSISPKDPNSVQISSGKIFFKRINENFLSNNSFVMETTLSGEYINNIIAKAQKLKYHVTIIFLFLENYKICIERITERVKKGGHFVPRDDVIRRFYRSQKKFWKKTKGMCDNWYLIYNSNLDFTEVAFGVKENFEISNENYFNMFIENVKFEG